MLKNVMRPFTDVVIINNLQRLELSCPCSVIARICGKGEVRGGGWRRDSGRIGGGLDRGKTGGRRTEEVLKEKRMEIGWRRRVRGRTGEGTGD